MINVNDWDIRNNLFFRLFNLPAVKSFRDDFIIDFSLLELIFCHKIVIKVLLSKTTEGIPLLITDTSKIGRGVVIGL